MTVAANRALARPSETVPLLEREAAFVAARWLDDERVAAGLRGPFEVFEMTDDVSLRDARARGELVRRQRAALQCVAQGLARGLAADGHGPSHGSASFGSPLEVLKQGYCVQPPSLGRLPGNVTMDRLVTRA